MLIAFIKGLVLGLVAGLPLGPASATVADTAIRKSLSRAMAVGLGGAIVDIIYCMAAVAGLGAIFDGRPGLRAGFLGIGGCVLVAFGLYTARSRPLELINTRNKRQVKAATLLTSVGEGVLVSVANPALVISWILLAGTVLSGMGTAESAVAGTAVFLGVFAWFSAIAWLSHMGRIKFGARAVWIPRAVGFLLVAYGVFLIGRVSLAWATGY